MAALTNLVVSKGTFQVMPGGNAGCSSLHALLDALGDIERIGLGQLEDGEARRRLPVELEGLAVLLGAELDAGDIAQPRYPAAAGRIGLDDDVLELGNVVELARHVDRVLEVLSGGHGRDAELSGPGRAALQIDGVDDVGGDQLARLQLLRVQPEPHGVLAGAEHGDVADAVDAGDLVEQIDGRIVRQEQAVVAAVRRAQGDDLEDRGRALCGLHALRLHGLRQRRLARSRPGSARGSGPCRHRCRCGRSR